MKKEKVLFAEKILRKDIKYRGKLSYRGVRVIAWIAMGILFASLILNSGVGFLEYFDKTEAAQRLTNVVNVFSYFAVLPLPLFFIANLGIIASERQNFKALILKFGVLAAGIFFGFLFVYLRYGLVFAVKITEGTENSAITVLDQLMDAIFSRKPAFNVFIDLLLMTLIMFFLNYHPKKYFQGKKIYLFRLMVLIPIIYDLVGVILVGFNKVYFHIPPLVGAILPTKPALLFFMFVGIILFMKLSERRMIKKGLSIGHYHEYLKTNGSSLTFSITVSVGLLIVSIIDLIAFILMVNTPDFYTYDWAYILVNMGLGETFCVFLAIPIVMLYSFNKKPKDVPNLDLLITIGGLGMVVIGILEGLFGIFMCI